MDTRKKTLRHSALFLTLFSPIAALATPLVNNDTRSAPQGTTVTIDVLNNDSDSEPGLSLSVTDVSQPISGSTTINSDGGITYTPNPENPVERIEFTYTVTNNAEVPESANGTVIILFDDSGLPQLFQDSGNQRNVSRALHSICQELAGSYEGNGSPADRLAAQCDGLLALSALDPEAAEAIVQQIAPEETLSLAKVGSNASQVQTQMVSSRMMQLGSGISTAAQGGLTWSGGRKGGAAGDGEIFTDWGFFGSLQLEDAEKDRTAAESGFDYSANGLALGADYALSQDWFIGGSFGLTTNDLKYKDKAGSVKADIYTFVAFSTFHKGNLSFDVQMGGGSSNIDVSRTIDFSIPGYENTATVNTQTEGQTSGEQWFITLQTQYAWSNKALTLYPSAKLTHSGSRVKGYADNNAGGWEVILDDQKEQKTAIEAGIQATYAINTSWGVLIPNAELNLFGTLDSGQETMEGYFAYAPQDLAMFAMDGEEVDSMYYQFGLGSSILLPGGNTGYLGLVQTLGYDDYSALQVQASFRMEF